jgi:hypothetical protein
MKTVEILQLRAAEESELRLPLRYPLAWPFPADRKLPAGIVKLFPFAGHSAGIFLTMYLALA